MKWIVGICLLSIIFTTTPSVALAIECGDPPPPGIAELKIYENSCIAKLKSLSAQRSTLKVAISVLDSKISLTKAQIAQTSAQIASLEKDVNTLTVVVGDLNKSLNDLAKVFAARVRQSYIHRTLDPITLFLSSESFSKFLTSMRYLEIAKAKDRLVLGEMTKARQDYDSQKNAKVEKQKQVEILKQQFVSQQADLSSQLKTKQSLLIATQNDEKKFQALLEQAKAEIEAINAILAGQGQEDPNSYDVNKGDVIAHVIQGASCNSGGSHLHFMVSDGTNAQNPFNYLKSIEYKNCSGSGSPCGSDDSDSFNPSGNWDWPINSPIKLTQGYGATWAIKHYSWLPYTVHNGIDIVSSSDEVHSVQSGRLYRGFYSGINGCALKYVRLVHKDGGLTTFYLHVNYK